MIINPYAFGQSYDPDAQAFFTASGLTGATNLTAINNLVVALKGFGIWTKMKAIYPMIGGTAALHKWNLKDPQDLDAAFRLVFSGGWTHSSTGALPNGTNGYSNTFLATNNMGLNSLHYAYYSRSNTAAASMQEMGALQNPGVIPGNSYSDLAIRFTSGAFVRLNNNAGVTFIANTDSRGFYIGTRTGSNTLKLFKNGSSIQSLADVSSFASTIFTYIGASNTLGSPAGYSNRECAFSSIGDGLTDAEAANFYTAVQAYQTTLSRQV